MARVDVIMPQMGESIAEGTVITSYSIHYTKLYDASMGLAGGAILGKGTLEQKQRWGKPILTWEKIGAWGMTEAGAGSDAFRSMRTVATLPDRVNRITSYNVCYTKLLRFLRVRPRCFPRPSILRARQCPNRLLRRCPGRCIPG